PDVVLLGPACFQADRDITFAHGGESSLLVHGRYILADGDVRFIAPEGGPDAQRIVDDYFQLLPPWRYLRYDRDTPMFVRGLLPEGRSLANPFYYRSDSEQAEAEEIYRHLLARLDRSSRGVVAIHMHESVAALVAAAGPRSFAAVFPGDDFGTFPN